MGATHLEQLLRNAVGVQERHLPQQRDSVDLPWPSQRDSHRSRARNLSTRHSALVLHDNRSQQLWSAPSRRRRP